MRPLILTYAFIAATLAMTIAGILAAAPGRCADDVPGFTRPAILVGAHYIPPQP